MSFGKKLAAEAIGTAWLVIGGCGTAILAGKGVGLVGISLAFGLTVVTMAYEGRADTLSVAIFGDGDVTFGGAAGALDAAVFGVGDIRVGHVDGQVNRRVFGGGMVIIGR